LPPERPLDRTLAAAAIAAVLTALAVAPAAAEVNIRGVSSCQTWLQERAPEGTGAVLEKSWLLGFASGLATATGADFWGSGENSLDNEQVFRDVDDYCKAHPANDIDDAGVAVFSERRKAFRRPPR